MSEAMKERQVTISVGFERKVVINYQTYVFSTHFAETVSVVSDADISNARKRLRLRAVGAVWSDVLGDFDRIATSLPNREDLVAQANALKAEASQSIQAVMDGLAALEPTK